jgi:uncharacterized membrane protein
MVLSLTAPLHRPALLTYLFFLAYSIVLACLLGHQSLWVDEIIQLMGTRTGTMLHTEQLTRSGPGSVPLGWLPQVFAIHFLGYSTTVARIPSALAGVGCCFTVFLTAKELGMRYPLLPAVLLSVLPLHFRYALEGRPYAQAVFLSALATLLFIKLLKRPSPLCFGAYTLVLAAGIYSQPFTCFTACSHFLWTLITARRRNRFVYFSGGALVFMVLTFLPWYFYASPLWQQTIKSAGLHFQLSLKTPLMLIREISGAGFLGGCALLLLAVIGFFKGQTTSPMKWLLVVCSIVPVICVLIVDAVFSYYLAIRQMIFILPPLVLLAYDGISTLMRSSRRKTFLATAVLAIIFAVADINWLQRPREDWELAARFVQHTRTQYSAGALYAPSDAFSYYTFFEPQLKDSICQSGQRPEGSVVVVTSPYANAADRESARKFLKAKSVVFSQIVGMSTIEVFR